MKEGAERPGRIRRDITRIRATADAITGKDGKAQQVAKEYEQAFDACVRSLQGGVRVIPSKGAGKSDPTGETATAWDYHRLQGATRYVARRVDAAGRKIRSAYDELDRALEGLHGAWLDTDPDLRKDRKELREGATEIAEGPAA